MADGRGSPPFWEISWWVRHLSTDARAVLDATARWWGLAGAVTERWLRRERVDPRRPERPPGLLRDWTEFRTLGQVLAAFCDQHPRARIDSSKILHAIRLLGLGIEAREAADSLPLAPAADSLRDGIGRALEEARAALRRLELAAFVELQRPLDDLSELARAAKAALDATPGLTAKQILERLPGELRHRDITAVRALFCTRHGEEGELRRLGYGRRGRGHGYHPPRGGDS